MERKLSQPGFWVAVLMTVMVVGLQMALATPLGVLDVIFERVMHMPPPQLARQPLMLGFINLVACGAPIAFGLYLNRLSFRRAFPIKAPTALQLLGIVTVVLGGGILISEADNAFRSLAPPPQWLREAMKDIFFPEGKLASRIFLLVLVAPVTEELLFRGLVLRGLLSRYRPAVAVLLTALLFAAVHLNPWQFASALCLGIIFGWFYLRTGSVAVCIAGHALTNGLSVVVSSLSVDIPGLAESSHYGRVEFQPWWLDLAGLALLVMGVLIFRAASPLPKRVEEATPPVIAGA